MAVIWCWEYKCDHVGVVTSTQGVIPRICQSLFQRSAQNTDPSITHKVEASYLEIYSERCRDLLDPRKKNLKIREHPETGPYVEDLSVCAVQNFNDLDNLMSVGNKERTVAATNMNAVCRLYLGTSTATSFTSGSLLLLVNKRRQCETWREFGGEL